MFLWLFKTSVCGPGIQIRFACHQWLVRLQWLPPVFGRPWARAVSPMAPLRGSPEQLSAGSSRGSTQDPHCLSEPFGDDAAPSVWTWSRPTLSSWKLAVSDTQSIHSSVLQSGDSATPLHSRLEYFYTEKFLAYCIQESLDKYSVLSIYLPLFQIMGWVTGVLQFHQLIYFLFFFLSVLLPFFFCIVFDIQSILARTLVDIQTIPSLATGSTSGCLHCFLLSSLAVIRCSRCMCAFPGCPRVSHISGSLYETAL